MAEKTKIAWCHHTFNPWIGCSRVAEGCKFCYAENLMDTRYHRVKWGPDGTRSRTKTWNQPPKWNRDATARGEKDKVFCASLADVFEDRDELTPWREEMFQLIDKCQNLHWLLLTKRPQNIINMWPKDGKYRENIWLGTSVALQKNVNEYVAPLIETKHLCKYLFLSVEPQIGPVDLAEYLFPKPQVNWCIFGGESKQGTEEPRPYDMDWARFNIKQCREAGVACFVKQFGSNVYDKGVRKYFINDHAENTLEWPADLRVRECPETYACRLASDITLMEGKNMSLERQYKEKNLIERLFPQLQMAQWGEVNINDVACDALKLIGPLLEPGQNPFLKAEICEQWKNFVHKLMKVDYSWGGYMEDRSVVWAGHYHEPGATVHCGVDYYVPTGTKIHMPVKAKLVKSEYDLDRNGGWGGKLIFQWEKGYIILAHLKEIVSDEKEYQAGEVVGIVAEPEINGGWSPHLHVQCCNKTDVDGYCRRYNEMEKDFPDPVEEL